MATIERLEDLKIWQISKEIAVSIYKLKEEKLNKDFSFRDQIRRSSVSVTSNIAEGFGRDGNKEFIQFLSVAKGSLFELKTQLLIAVEIDYLSLEEMNSFGQKIEELIRLITGLMNYLKSSNLKGKKFN